MTVRKLILVILLSLIADAASAQSLRAGLEAVRAKDYVRALAELRPLAEKGHPLAQYHVGLMYSQGRGVEQDRDEAFRWYQKAAEQGEPRAQTNLASYYDNGFVVAKNYEIAYQWFLKAAAQGSVPAYLALAQMSEHGHGVKANPIAALEWDRKAAEAGHPIGQHRLGMAYLFGYGVAMDTKAAYHWLGKAADQGVAVALVTRGHLRLDGIPALDVVAGCADLELGIARMSPTHVQLKQAKANFNARCTTSLTREALQEVNERVRNWKPQEAYREKLDREFDELIRMAGESK